LLEAYPAIDPNDEYSFANHVRKINALLSFYMNIPFPEQLDDDTWCEKYRQFQWLAEAGHLPVKFKKGE